MHATRPTMCHLLPPFSWHFSTTSISSFFLRFHFFLRGGPGVCGTITATRKGKWVPCVWWRAAASVTQYNHGGIAPEIHLLTLGGGKQRSLNCCLHLSVTLFCSPVHLWVQSVGAPQIPVISPLKSVEWGPLLPGLPLCFGVLDLCCIVTLKGGEWHQVPIVSDVSAWTEKANLCCEPDDSSSVHWHGRQENLLLSLKMSCSHEPNRMAQSYDLTYAHSEFSSFVT